ncbi:21535_t:CDS:2 [Gigaspora rosea]|nr:21535_t:CDS:2 [Gigaspora rosea]
MIDTWPDYKHNGCPMKTNMLLESYFKKDIVLHYRGRFTKSLHSSLEKISTSMRVDAGEIDRAKNPQNRSYNKKKAKYI